MKTIKEVSRESLHFFSGNYFCPVTNNVCDSEECLECQYSFREPVNRFITDVCCFSNYMRISPNMIRLYDSLAKESSYE